jgi:nicotinamide riboside kinase
MLVVVLAAGARGTWRWGREVEAANVRADKAELAAKEWQGTALTAMRAGTRAVEVAEKVANGKST